MESQVCTTPITAVTTVTATDVDGSSFTYSISGGADAAKFSIVGATVLTAVLGLEQHGGTTAVGLVLLAHAPVDVQEEILGGPLERYTPWTVTDPPELRRFGVTWLPGNLDRQGVADRYAEATGRDVSGVLFYFVYGLFKVGVIGQQIYARFKAGKTRDPRFAGLLHVVRACGRTAAKARAFSSHGAALRSAGRSSTASTARSTSALHSVSRSTIRAERSTTCALSFMPGNHR